MTGREKVLAAVAASRAARSGGAAVDGGPAGSAIPWVPFAGVHAGKLKGHSARDVLTDRRKLVESLLEVNRLYKPDGQPVLFDLQIEAEALGCELAWADNAPPSVAGHPLEHSDEIPSRGISAADGRVPFVLEAMREMKREVGATTALYGLACGPFTLASHLRGTELFLDMVLNEDYAHRLIDWATGVVSSMCGLYADAGMDIVAVVDPLVSQISPDHFVQFLEAPFSRIFELVRTRRALSSFFVCGNATNNIEPMCRTGPDNISVDENVSLPAAKRVTDRYGVSIGGNIPLTSVMLFGSQQDNMKAVVDLLDSVSHTGLIVSPGCDMPYDIPPENPIAVEQAIHETALVREMVAAYESKEFEFHGTLPDYSHLDRPFIEVFTLNSATCAACTYMWKAALDAKREFGDAVDIVEYPYTTRENIARCAKMGVSKLPSLYINGELAYSSLIPNREELLARIRSTIQTSS